MSPKILCENVTIDSVDFTVMFVVNFGDKYVLLLKLRAFQYIFQCQHQNEFFKKPNDREYLFVESNYLLTIWQ